ncbi:hypothetical protein BT69DRAFT_1343770 [Atractiella rhizophila]|nr:hypothetical protein BT69DRAFT_1343770 [Atractiella rhizophila]
MTIPHPEYYANSTSIISGATFSSSDPPASSPSETDSNSPNNGSNLNDSGLFGAMDLSGNGAIGEDGLDPKSGKVKKSSLSSAERRATHNAIERARRESLNGRDGKPLKGANEVADDPRGVAVVGDGADGVRTGRS